MKLISLLCVFLLTACAATEKKGADAKAAASGKAAAAGDAAAQKADKAIGAAGTITCKSASETRVLTTTPVDKGCEVVYERNGEKTVAASAKNDPTHCGKVAERIRGNLEKSGFKCAAN